MSIEVVIRDNSDYCCAIEGSIEDIMFIIESAITGTTLNPFERIPKQLMLILERIRKLKDEKSSAESLLEPAIETMTELVFRIENANSRQSRLKESKNVNSPTNDQ